MRILQEDPGVDGWWVLVETDDGTQQHLINVPDGKGRKAPKPSKASIENRLARILSISSESKSEGNP